MQLVVVAAVMAAVMAAAMICQRRLQNAVLGFIVFFVLVMFIVLVGGLCRCVSWWAYGSSSPPLYYPLYTSHLI